MSKFGAKNLQTILTSSPGSKWNVSFWLIILMVWDDDENPGVIADEEEWEEGMMRKVCEDLEEKENRNNATYAVGIQEYYFWIDLNLNVYNAK